LHQHGADSTELHVYILGTSSSINIILQEAE